MVPLYTCQHLLGSGMEFDYYSLGPCSSRPNSNKVVRVFRSSYAQIETSPLLALNSIYVIGNMVLLWLFTPCSLHVDTICIDDFKMWDVRDIELRCTLSVIGRSDGGIHVTNPCCTNKNVHLMELASVINQTI